MNHSQNTPEDWIETIKKELLLVPIMGAFPALFIYGVDGKNSLKAFANGATESTTLFYYLLACFLLNIFLAWVYLKRIRRAPESVENGLNGLRFAGSIGASVADGFVSIYRVLLGVLFVYMPLILFVEPGTLAWTDALMYLFFGFLLWIATCMFSRAAAWASDAFNQKSGS